MASNLLERELEIDRLRTSAQRGATGKGACVAVTGRAGTGKTSLLRATAEWIPPEFSVAHFACRREHQTRPFALLEQIARSDLFPGRSQLLAKLLRGETITEDQAKEGLYWTISGFTATQPLVVTVDDVHWIDAASLVPLRDLLRRIDDLPSLVVVAARLLEAGPSSGYGALLQQVETTLVLREFTLAATTRLIRGRFPEASEAFVEDCYETTSGNPYLLASLLEAIGAESLPLDRLGIEAAAPRGPGLFLAERISSLSQEAQLLANAIALLGNGRDIEATADVAGLERDEAIEAGGELIARGIVSTDGEGRFVHDLVRIALLSTLDDPERDRALMRAASVTRRHGWDEFEVSQILVQSAGPLDIESKAMLLTAAQGSLERGAPTVALELLQRALRDVPQPDAQELGLLAQATGGSDLPTAIEYLERAVGLERDPHLLEHLADAYVANGRYSDAHPLFGEAAELAGDDPQHQRHLKAREFTAAAIVGEKREEAESELRTLAGATLLELTPADRTFLATISMGMAYLNGTDREEAVFLATRAWDDGRILDGMLTGDETPYLITGVLNSAEKHEDNLEVTAQLLARAREEASLPKFGSACYVRMSPLYGLGRVDEVVAYGASAREAEARGWQQYNLAARGAHALGLIELDELAAAEEVLQPISLADTMRVDAVMLKIALGRLELAREHYAEAANYLQGCFAALEGFGFRGCDTLPYPDHLFEALWRAGKEDDAGQYFETYAERARVWGTARAIARELRMRSALEPQNRIDLLKESIAVARLGETVLDRLYVQKELGDAYLAEEMEADARSILHEVVETAGSLGCRLLTRHALASLSAAGGRPRRVPSSGLEILTPSEKQIAALAAEGQSNAEIAEALFVSVRTVKFHLTNVFRKLGVEGRMDIVRFFE